jgi:2-ketocyclohexanecarboxyl-CoA hydrolase
MESQSVLQERRGDVLWITLNQPARLNAYDEAMALELTAAIRSALDITAVVITGSGRGFCAGGYLANLQEIDPIAIRRLYRSSLDLFETMRLCPAPIIGAINGVAAGGGNELVVACDLAIAAESATFGQTGPRVGSSPVLGGANMLAMAIGEKRAKEVAFLCRRYSAAEALSMGWINAVVPDDDLVNEVSRWTDELGHMSPRYLEMTKLSSNVWWNCARDAYVQGVGMLTQAIGSYDMTEGATAFMEKRPAHFLPRSVLDPLGAAARASREDNSDDKATASPLVGAGSSEVS